MPQVTPPDQRALGTSSSMVASNDSTGWAPTMSAFMGTFRFVCPAAPTRPGYSMSVWDSDGGPFRTGSGGAGREAQAPTPGAATSGTSGSIRTVTTRGPSVFITRTV